MKAASNCSARVESAFGKITFERSDGSNNKFRTTLSGGVQHLNSKVERADTAALASIMFSLAA